ncbi:MAG: hypothetical protein E7672_08655 [Ruminococcaceae bacterium]|nr:hypothetical protein [Oscillospiraceae bacterium]
MQYIDFYGHKLSKLIVGDNPYNGHSYIPEWVDGNEMRLHYTEERILADIKQMEELGINTMLPLADPFIIRVLQHYRAAGGKMNFIFQTYGPMMDVPKVTTRLMMSVDPIGIYLSGTYVDVRFETGRSQEIFDMREKLLEFAPNVKIGLGTHRPDVIRTAEDEGWNFDFYMACLYNGRRGREGEESGFITGKTKSDLYFLPSDRAVMLEALKDVKSPIIAFKLFAGGQMLVGKSDEERRSLIRDVYNTVFTSLKPDDLAVMGIFQKYRDQLTENVSIFEEWAEEQK